MYVKCAVNTDKNNGSHLFSVYDVFLSGKEKIQNLYCVMSYNIKNI